MTKKVGRNDPCPCGSGKKFKNCCESRIGPKRKFQATHISGGGMKGKATQISTNFFSNLTPRKPADDQPHHPPEADRPM